MRDKRANYGVCMANFVIALKETKKVSHMSPKGGLMSVYFCPYLMFNYGYLIEFVCLKIDLLEISYYWVY